MPDRNAKRPGREPGFHGRRAARRVRRVGGGGQNTVRTRARSPRQRCRRHPRGNAGGPVSPGWSGRLRPGRARPPHPPPPASRRHAASRRRRAFRPQPWRRRAHGPRGASPAPPSMRNSESAAISSSDFASRSAAEAVVSSDTARFCCVAWSSWLTPVLISFRPLACSEAADAISSTKLAALLRLFQNIGQRLAGLVDQAGAGLDLFGAFRNQFLDFACGIRGALCARSRTSEATTANPRPASPARAASTPAFKASRLV
jgi:hypothetical protein